MTQDLREILPRDFVVTKLNDSPFTFLEGPVWDKRRSVLYFSDIYANKILAMPQTGIFRVVQENTGYGNGMCLNKDGNLAVCRMGPGVVEEICPDTGKNLRVIADTYNGRPLTSTNDIICDEAGGYYFTDPFFTYGPHTQDLDATYYCAPDGKLTRVATDSKRPNGLAFSSDKKKLYIDDTDNVEVWRYDVRPDGTLSEGVVFCRLAAPQNAAELPPVQQRGEADGLKVDSCGNVYVTTYDGVQVFNEEGKALGIIPMPADESPANCAFGGDDMHTLFLTARTSLYSVKLLVPGL